MLPLSAVPPPQEPPAGPSEVEQRLQAEAEQLRKDLESLAGQLQAQVQDNEGLSRLNQEQEQRLLELEREAECWGQQAEQQKQILEDMQNNRVTISRALSQNRELKEQLAELQDGFVKLVCPLPGQVLRCKARHLPLLGLVFPSLKRVVRAQCAMVPLKAPSDPESPAPTNVGRWGVPTCLHPSLSLGGEYHVLGSPATLGSD